MEIQQFSPFTITPCHFHPIPNSNHHPVLVSPLKQQRNLLKLSPLFCSSSHSNPVVQDPILQQGNGSLGKSRDTHYKNSRKKRVFFLDVNPICYKGSIPSLQSFAHWISIFFSQVSLTDPVIAVSFLSVYNSVCWARRWERKELECYGWYILYKYNLYLLIHLIVPESICTCL